MPLQLETPFHKYIYHSKVGFLTIYMHSAQKGKSEKEMMDPGEAKHTHV